MIAGRLDLFARKTGYASAATVEWLLPGMHAAENGIQQKA